MTPRATVSGIGLPGVGQERFPQGAKDSGLDLGLMDEVTILEDAETDDGAGSVHSEWTDRETVRGRLDPITVSNRGMRDQIGDQLKEESTHVVTVDPGVDLTTANRVRINGQTWIVTAKLQHSNPLTERVAVRGL